MCLKRNLFISVLIDSSSSNDVNTVPTSSVHRYDGRIAMSEWKMTGDERHPGGQHFETKSGMEAQSVKITGTSHMNQQGELRWGQWGQRIEKSTNETIKRKKSGYEERTG